MKQNVRKSEIKVKLMLLSNYITYGDFEMSKGIMQQILDEDKQFLWSLIDSILKKSLVSLFPDTGNKIQNASFLNKLLFFTLKIANTHYKGEISKDLSTKLEDLLAFDSVMISLMNKIHDQNFNYRIFYEMRQFLLQKESDADSPIVKNQEEYTENTGSLKMIIYNYPEETRALYDLMNKRHRERGEATSLSHIYNALKEVLWTSFEERNLDIIYNYLFLISVKEDLLSNLKSNASFEKNDFKKKYYEEIGSLIYNYSRDIVRENSIRSESNPTPTPRIRNENDTKFEIIKTLEAFFKDSSLRALHEFEMIIRQHLFQSKGNHLGDFINILKCEKLENPLNFWERLILYSHINEVNPITTAVEISKKAFFTDNFEYNSYVCKEMPQIQDLITLIIANNINKDLLERYYFLLKTLKAQINITIREKNPNLNKSLKQLEGISQDLQFQVYLLRWLYKFAFKTSRIRGITYSQFSRLDSNEFADMINLPSFNGEEIKVFIKKIEDYKFPETNIILKNQAKRLVHLFRILLVKDTLLEDFRLHIMLTTDRPLQLSKESISLIDNLIKDILTLQSSEEICEDLLKLSSVLRNILFLKFGDLKFIEYNTSKSNSLKNVYVLSPIIILDISERLEFINNLCIERNSPNEDLDKFLKLWLLRTRIYKELSDKRLLLNDSYPINEVPNLKLDQGEIDRARNSNRITMSDIDYKNVSDTDHLEIFYDHEEKLIKYLLVMKSNDLLEQFFKTVNTRLSQEAFAKFLERRNDSISHKISTINTLVHPHPSEIIDSFILFGLTNTEDLVNKEVDQGLKLKKIIQSPLFKKFPWIRKDTSDSKKEEFGEQKSVQFNKELSLLFLEEMEKLFKSEKSTESKRNSFEERLTHCVKTLSQYKGAYKYLNNFISYIEKLYIILKDALVLNQVIEFHQSNHKGNESNTIENWLSKLFFDLNSDEFITEVSKIPGSGLETCLSLSKKMKIDILSPLLLFDLETVEDQQEKERLIVKAEWIFEQEAKRELKFLSFSEIPFSTIVIFFKYKGNSDYLPLLLLLLKKAETFASRQGNHIMARFFSSFYQISTRKIRKEPLDKTIPSPDRKEKRKIIKSEDDDLLKNSHLSNIKGLLPLIVSGADSKKTEKEKIYANVISTQNYNKHFSDISPDKVLENLKVLDEGPESNDPTNNPLQKFLIPNHSSYLDQDIKKKPEKKDFERQLYRQTTKEAIMRFFTVNKEKLKDWKCTLFTDYLLQNSNLFNQEELFQIIEQLEQENKEEKQSIKASSQSSFPESPTNREVVRRASSVEKDNNQLWESIMHKKEDFGRLQDALESLPLDFIKLKLNGSIDETMLTLKSQFINKKKLWGLREKLSKISLINSQFGPIADVQLISSLFLTVDLLDLCLANNVSTEFSFHPHDTLLKFIKKIEKRLFNNGHINDLLEVLKKRNIDISFVHLWKWESLIFAVQFKEARKQAEIIFDQAATVRNANKLLDFLISRLEACSYKNSAENVMSLHRLQILRECNIKPLIVVENKVREEIENYKQTVTNECIYYLSKFGTPERQAKFYRSNNQLEQALKISVFNGVHKKFFVEEIIKPVWKNKQLSNLRTYLKKLDPQLSHSNDYLQATIEFLTKKEDYEELYHFQTLIGDYQSAGDWCLIQFKNAKTFKEKLRYLEEAEKNFKLFLEKPGHSQNKLSIDVEIKLLLKKIKLQKDILDDYPELLQANVFENVESVYLICEIILLSNPRQSLNILQMLKISLNGFLSHILSKFSYENRLNSIEETLQTFAELKRKNLIPEALKLTDNEWDNRLFSVGASLCKNYGEYVRYKIVPRISQEDYRTEILAMLEENAEAI